MKKTSFSPLNDFQLNLLNVSINNLVLIYRLFRKDGKGNHGEVAVFVHDALVATRRDDLELNTVEGMWLEIAVP